MKATPKPTQSPDPLDNFHHWIMTGRAFQLPIANDRADEARAMLRYSRRVFREARLADGHIWFIVEAAKSSRIAGGLERVGA